MRYFLLFWVLIVFLLPASSNAEITGKVVDAETGDPIEGAVVLVEWTVIKGFPGMTNTESLKVVEAVTDREGRFSVDDKIPDPELDFRLMAINRVNPPQVSIYKRGYVAWSSRLLFPTYKRREDFMMKDNYIYGLQRVPSEYSCIQHIDFIHLVIGFDQYEKKKGFRKALEWEERKAAEENRRKR